MLTDFLQELFNYCFPPDYRACQRDRLKMCKHGNRSVREFVRHLQDLANSVGDITDSQLVHYFWEGAADYLQLDWAKAGFDPESSTFQELEAAAENYERAEQMRKHQKTGHVQSGSRIRSHGQLNNNTLSRDSRNDDNHAQPRQSNAKSSQPP